MGAYNIELSKEAGPPAGMCYLFTFPFSIIVDRDIQIPIHEVRAGELAIRIYPPFRSAPANYLPTPEVRLSEVPWMPSIRAKIDPAVKLMRLAPIFQLGLNENGTVSVILTVEEEWEEPPKQFPMDSLRLDVLSNGSTSSSTGDDWPDYRAQASSFVSLFISWLRVLSKQWWVGRSVDALIGYMQSGFPVDKQGLPLHQAGPHVERSRAINGDEIPIDNELWELAVKKTEEGTEPPLQDILLLDARYHLASEDLRRAIIDAATACEIARDQAFTRIHVRPKDKTNLLNHISRDLQQRKKPSYEVEEPSHFERVRELWIARGHIAHGKEPTYHDRAAQVTGSVDGEKMTELSRSAENLVRWLEKIQQRIL